LFRLFGNTNAFMKYLFTFLLLLFLSPPGHATSVSIGFASDKLTVWRYWEINEQGRPVPRMIVYNKTDSSVTLCVTKTEYDSLTLKGRTMMKDRYHMDNDTAMAPAELAPHACGIYDMRASRESGLYDELFVDGQSCGILPDMGALQLGKYEHKYYSRESYGNPCPCLFGVDDLFSERNKAIKMTLYFNCDYKDPRETFWQLSAEINEGVKSILLEVEGEGGETYSMDATLPKVSFHVPVQYASVFIIEATYKLAKNTIIPSVKMRRSFAYGDSGFELPLFVKEANR